MKRNILSLINQRDERAFWRGLWILGFSRYPQYCGTTGDEPRLHTELPLSRFCIIGVQQGIAINGENEGTSSPNLTSIQPFPAEQFYTCRVHQTAPVALPQNWRTGGYPAQDFGRFSPGRMTAPFAPRKVRGRGEVESALDGVAATKGRQGARDPRGASAIRSEGHWAQWLRLRFVGY